jgi:hypothetical protein
VGGERKFAAGASWIGQLEESGHSGLRPSVFDFQVQRMAAVSSLYRISAMQLKSAITVETKTFNNHLGFERGLWQHQTRRFVVVPKRSVLGTPIIKPVDFERPSRLNEPQGLEKGEKLPL